MHSNLNWKILISNIVPLFSLLNTFIASYTWLSKRTIWDIPKWKDGPRFRDGQVHFQHVLLVKRNKNLVIPIFVISSPYIYSAYLCAYLWKEKKKVNLQDEDFLLAQAFIFYQLRLSKVHFLAFVDVSIFIYI